MLLYYYSKFLKKLRGVAAHSSKVHKTSKLESGTQFINSRMEKHSFCGYNCDIINCEVGSFVSISDNVIIGGGMHPLDWVGMSPVFYKGRDSVKAKFSSFDRESSLKTIIGNDVWIGNRVLIKQGVIVGDGSVIGMGSVVTKNVEPYSIVAGNPAKLIRYRFEQEIINELLKIKWWDLDEINLKKISNNIKNPKKFIKSYYNLIK